MDIRKLTPALFALVIGALLGGCSKDCVDCVDETPPAVPTGVFSVTGDGRVTLYWNDIFESDLQGYAVYRDSNADGLFEHLTDLARADNFDGTTGLHWYVDDDVTNGALYEYAVASFDRAGNESELSFETVTDIPRPEGFDVVLYDRTGNPAAAGFDFWNQALANGQRVSSADPAADIVVEWQGAVPYVLAARGDVFLQDYGNVMGGSGFVDLDLLSYAPLEGWSLPGRAELIPGHAYVVRIGASPFNYAKFAVVTMDDTVKSVTVDWAYQLVPGSRELKAPPAPNPRRGELAESISF